MPGLSEPPQRHVDLTETAAAWLAALDAGSADVALFEAWRAADVRHAVAFAEVAGTWRDLDAIRTTRTVVEPAYGAWAREPADAARPNRRQLFRTAASVAAVAVVGGGFAYRAQARDRAVTGIGQRETVVATAGLTLDLNTDSCVYWKDGTPARLWLERGEVAIRLAGSRGLDLLTPGGRFRLTPGRYNARMRGVACELAVLSGSLSDSAGSRVGAGQVGLAHAGLIRPRSYDGTDLGRITAWQRDTLILNGESLDYALAEMNRYRSGKIMIGDPALSRLRIGGTFSTTDPAEFLQALRTAFGVRTTATAAGDILLNRA